MSETIVPGEPRRGGLNRERSLYHLLLVSARSVAQSNPELEPRIDDIAKSLRLDRIDRAHLRATWSESGETYERTIDGRSFTLYARGDVPSLVAKRAENTDLRQQNWDAATAVWGDFLGVSGQLKASSSLAPMAPPAERVRRLWWWVAAAFLASSGIAIVGGTASPLLVGLAVLCVGHLLVVDFVPARTMALMAVAAVGAAIAVALSDTPVGGAAVVLSFVAAAWISGIGLRVLADRIAGGVVVGIAAGGALVLFPRQWWFAVPLVMIADLIGKMLRGDRPAVRSQLVAMASFVIAVIVIVAAWNVFLLETSVADETTGALGSQLWRFVSALVVLVCLVRLSVFGRHATLGPPAAVFAVAMTLVVSSSTSADGVLPVVCIAASSGALVASFVFGRGTGVVDPVVLMGASQQHSDARAVPVSVKRRPDTA